MSNEPKKLALFKFTLSTDKTIHLREPKISDTRVAAQIAGKIAGDNNAHLQVMIQEELCKLVLVKLNDEELKPQNKERLDDLFSIKEYNQVIQAIRMVGGDEDGEQGKPVMSIDTTGN